MKAIIANRPFELSEGNFFYETDINMPVLNAHDVLVKVEAISVNPVDGKTRIRPINGQQRILGYDAVGKVEAVGQSVSMFDIGDVVFYAGTSSRPGANAEYHAVDERLIAKAPTNISAQASASLPLTAITASEVLFDVFNIATDPELNQHKTILIINGAGGVGSIATQIAKAYGLKVITTASRPESIQWSLKMGADIVLNHHDDLVQQLHSEHGEFVDFIFCTYDTDMYYNTMIELVKPLGKIATIVAFKEKQDLNALKPKSLTLTHEFMFARPVFNTDDMIKHQEYLTDVAKKIEAGIYQPTTTKVIEGLSAEHLYDVHQIIESNQMIGKLVIKL